MDKIAIVNEKDEIIGYEEKMKVHKKGILHRAFSIFIFNSKGEMLLQKRAKEKYHSGGLWTNACCSHTREGETFEYATRRRLIEEINISCDVREIFVFKYDVKFDNGLIENEIDHAFIGFTDKDPILNPEEAEEFKWISLENLMKEIKSNPKSFTYWFKVALNDHFKVFEDIISKKLFE